MLNILYGNTPLRLHYSDFLIAMEASCKLAVPRPWHDILHKVAIFTSDLGTAQAFILEWQALLAITVRRKAPQPL